MKQSTARARRVLACLACAACTTLLAIFVHRDPSITPALAHSSPARHERAHDDSTDLRASPASAERLPGADTARTKTPSSKARATDAWRPAEAMSDDEIVAAIAALSDDDIPHNAGRAASRLHSEERARPALIRALRSKDAQQRILAAAILTSAYHLYSKPGPDDWLRVLVEGLHSRYDSIRVVQGSMRVLVGKAQRVPHALARGLASSDRQKRFLCAYLLAHDRVATDLDRVCAILVPHLNTNAIRADANMSARALYLAGPLILPFLWRHARTLDAQGKMLADRIRFRLQHPGIREIDSLHEPLSSSFLTRYRKPLLEYECGWGWFPTFR